MEALKQGQLQLQRELQEINALLRRRQSAVTDVGVQATPSFLLGIAEPGGSSVRVVKMIAGAHPYPVFKEAIDSLPSIETPGAPPGR